MIKISDEIHIELDTELTHDEQIFKTWYLNNVGKDISEPHSMEYDKQTILDDPKLSKVKLWGERLDENMFSNQNLDVQIYQHIRYLPCWWHSHDFYEVACLLEGNCINYITGQKIQMQKGDVCIIAPGRIHAISAFSDDCILFNILLRASTFETAFFETLHYDDILAEFFKHTLYYSVGTPYLLFRTGGDSELMSFIGHAYREFHSHERYHGRMLNNVIEAFFTILLRKHREHIVFAEEGQMISSENQIYILQYIQEHYNTVTLEELSGFFNYSERHIQRMIEECTGTGYMQNIQKLKMRRAAKLLVEKKFQFMTLRWKLVIQIPVTSALHLKNIMG